MIDINKEMQNGYTAVTDTVYWCNVCHARSTNEQDMKKHCEKCTVEAHMSALLFKGHWVKSDACLFYCNTANGYICSGPGILLKNEYTSNFLTPMTADAHTLRIITKDEAVRTMRETFAKASEQAISDILKVSAKKPESFPLSDKLDDSTHWRNKDNGKTQS